MCNSRKDTLATDPRPAPRTPKRTSSTSARTASTSSSDPRSVVFPTSSGATSSNANTGRTTGSSSKPSTASTASSLGSLANLRDFLSESPTLYPFSEICSATNNFLSKRLSSSSSSAWRCTVRGKDAVVFQRRFRGDPTSLRRRLAATCKIHHNSIVRLLGASLGGDHIYLVYEYVNGASLADCLRNPRNLAYTPLSTWVDRMQVATDVAQGLEYIHHYAATSAAAEASLGLKAGGGPQGGLVHCRITSSGVMVTDPQLRAKICHFGAAELAGEIPASPSDDEAEISEGSPHASPKLQRSASREVRFEGTRGYIAPEILDGSVATQKSDVFAFGVLLLELLAGEEPVKYRYNRETKGYERVSLVEMAREAMGTEEGEGGATAGEADRHWRIRRWVDRRLKDSFPVDVAERMLRVALECVAAEAGRRPDMVRVAGKVSRLLEQSRVWADKVRVPADFSVSMAPR